MSNSISLKISIGYSYFLMLYQINNKIFKRNRIFYLFIKKQNNSMYKK